MSPAETPPARDRIPPRLTPVIYFLMAHAALLAAFALAVAHPAEVSGYFYQPRMIALVHLITLGWITASILGSLYVIGPMALRSPMPEGRADLIVALLYAIGLCGMVSHFWLNAYGGAGWAALLVVGAALHVGFRALRSVRQAPVQPAVKLHLLLALVNLALAGSLGILLAFDKAHPFLPAIELGNVMAHAHLAAIGWVGMMVMGTGLRMLPMVLPAAMPAGKLSIPGALLTEAGILGVSGILMLGSAALGGFALLVAAGFAVFLGQAIWMRRHLRPAPAGLPRPDLGVWHVLQALVYLLLAVALGIFLAFTPESDLTYRLAPVYGVAGLLGFYGQLVLGIESRILPMFAAYYANRRACGAGPVIQPHEMPRRGLQTAVFALWSAGLPVLAAGMSLARPGLCRTGASLLLLAALALAINQARVLAHLFRGKASRPLSETAGGLS
ncbi:MAG TPA: hypothetical protein VFW45_10000 [Candidatus Polarisedimenticolia bacterium]|nr:hypothetical protein [Candidatus Polarisedimenticolia bacterium]